MQAKKKLWTIAAALIIPSAFAAVAATPAAAQSFGDDAIQTLHDRGVLTGTGCSPGDCDGFLLRWEAAFWLTRAFDIPSAQAVELEDVPANRPLTRAASALQARGVPLACTSEPLRLCPQQEVTRAEMAVFLAHALQLKGTESAGFTDVSPDAPYAASVDAIREAGLTRGCASEPALYCPDDSISHREAAVMIHRRLRQPEPASDTSTGGSTGTTTGNTGATTGNTGGNTGNTGGTTGSTGGTTVPEGADPTGSGPTGSNPTRVPPTSRPGCAVVDHHDTHHDIDDHRGDPAGVQAWALLRDGTLFAHRHPTNGPAKCWLWPPPDADGNSQNPQNARAPSHTH